MIIFRALEAKKSKRNKGEKQMSKKVIQVLLIMVLVFAIAACAPDNDVNGTPAVEETPDEDVIPETGVDLTADEQHLMDIGETVYTAECAACHMEDGTGANDIYPALAGNPFVEDQDPEPVIEIILFGRGAMPSFGERLDDEEIAGVVSYIRNTWGNNASMVTPEEVQQVR
jgi:mono/diheme cytochrome c family protein